MQGTVGRVESNENRFEIVYEQKSLAEACESQR